MPAPSCSRSLTTSSGFGTSSTIARRYDVVESARAAGITWREAATTLKMTETGLMKTQTATRERLRAEGNAS